MLQLIRIRPQSAAAAAAAAAAALPEKTLKSVKNLHYKADTRVYTYVRTYVRTPVCLSVRTYACVCAYVQDGKVREIGREIWP